MGVGSLETVPPGLGFRDYETQRIPFSDSFNALLSMPCTFASLAAGVLNEHAWRSASVSCRPFTSSFAMALNIAKPGRTFTTSRIPKTRHPGSLSGGSGSVISGAEPGRIGRSGYYSTIQAAPIRNHPLESFPAYSIEFSSTATKAPLATDDIRPECAAWGIACMQLGNAKTEP